MSDATPPPNPAPGAPGAPGSPGSPGPAPAAAGATPAAPASPPAAGASFYDAKFSIEAMQHEPYQDGFTWRAVVGALFVAFVMMPGTIFMGLMIGTDLGTATDWVVIILFVELARRSFVTLRKQELYILKYTVSHLSHVAGGLVLGGGIFAGLVANRYMRNSEPFKTMNIAEKVPDWWAPLGDAAYRPFVDSIWWPVITVAVSAMLLSKLTQLSLGYLAYKLTVDVERLPFPLAPIHAEGAIALAESSQDKQKKGFRQYCFSIGVVCGAVFGFFYAAVPTLSQAFLNQTVQIIPIPFLDLTVDLEGYLPGGIVGIALNLGLLFTGFVLPWRVAVGMFVTTIVCQLIINPFILQPAGLLTRWLPGKNAIETQVANSLDVYMSAGIGTAFAIALMGVISLVRAMARYARAKRSGQAQAADAIVISNLWKRDVARGDPPTWAALAVWLASALGFVLLSDYLINAGARPEERFSVWWLVGFAFVWTPLNTYINARLSGIAGAHTGVPFIFESAIFVSGTKSVPIWFAPLPLANFGTMADLLRETQLTRTRFTSILKAELLLVPLMLVASFVFWSYITSLGPIPSENYPYAQMFWPLHAQMKAIWASGMQEGNSLLQQAIKPWLIGGACVGAMALFGLFGLLGISTQYIYGGLGAMNGYPHTVIPIFIGACLGRYYFAPKFTVERWTNFAPILAVGFGVGMGLIGMLAIAVHFLWKSIGTT